MTQRAGGLGLETLRPSLRFRIQLRKLRRLFAGRGDEDRAIERNGVARAAILIATATYVLYTAWLSIRTHWGYGHTGFDIGIFDQGLWLLSRFKDPFITIMGVDLFGDHTSFILLPLVPLYWIHPTAAILLAAQALALGAGAMAAFMLARDRLRDETLAAGLGVAYLLHPAVGWANLENFHPDVFEVPLVLFALVYMLRERWIPYFAFVVAAMFVKEDVGLLVVGMGIFIAIRLNMKVGLATIALAVTWFLANLLVILPAFNDQGTLDAWRIPSEEFGGQGGLIKAIFTRPWDVAAIALREDKPYYVFQLLAPLAFLPLRGWGLALIAAGPLASNLMSTFFYQYHIEYHYSTLIIPVFVGAAIIGVSRFPRTLRLPIVVVVLAASFLSALVWGPFFGRYPGLDPGTERASEVRAALQMIDDDAVVSAHYSFTAYLTHRERVYEFPVPWRAQNWGNFEEDGEDLGFGDEIDVVVVPFEELSDADAQILEDLKSEFSVAYERDGIVILERGET